MKKSFLFVSILLCGMVCLMGCGSEDSDDSASSSAAAPAAPSSSSGSAPAAPSANPAADPAANPDAAADAAFAKIGIVDVKLTEKIPNGGQGMVYKLTIAPIAGATSYTMISDIDKNKTSTDGNFILLKTGPDEPFGILVFAINANGVHTKTTSGEVRSDGTVYLYAPAPW